MKLYFILHIILFHLKIFNTWETLYYKIDENKYKKLEKKIRELNKGRKEIKNRK